MIRRTLVIVLFFTAVLTSVPSPGLALDPAGGAAAEARAAEPTTSLTFLPRLDVIRYGRSIRVEGALTTDGAPIADATVLVHRVGAATGTEVVTDAMGRYVTTISPHENAAWVASSGDLQSAEVLIKVAPKVTLALSHKRTASRLAEYFSGSVAPSHAGRTMLVQRATKSGWRTVASGKLNASSRYRIAWVLPRRSATYRLRVVLPAHGDHVQGNSPPATLQVVVNRG